MIIMTFAEATTGIVALVSALGSMAAIAFSLKKTTSDIDKQNIQSLQTRVQLVEQEKDDVKKRLAVCEGLHRDNLAKQGEMHGTIKTMEKILQDRNPETVKFMDYLTKVASNSEEHMRKSNVRDEEMLASLKAITISLESVSAQLAGTVKA